MRSTIPQHQSRFPDIFFRPLVHLLLIAGIALVAYSNTFHVPFVFDDIKEIVENPIIKDFAFFRDPSSASGLPAFHGLKMRTIGYFTLALNYNFGGTDVTGYHVFNLAIHILNALLVYAFLRLTLRTPFFQDEIQGARFKVQGPTTQKSKLKSQNLIPLFVALLFAVHPIQTQAVTYVIQRLASLATFFCLLSLTSYIVARLRMEEKRAGKAFAWFLLSFAAAAAAMRTKEIAFTLPVVIALYEFLFLRGKLWRRLLFLTPLLATMLIIPLRLTGISKPVGEIISHAGTVSRVDQAVSRSDYLCTQFPVIVNYIRLLILPVNQNLDHDYPLHPDFLTPKVFLSFLFLAALFGLGVYLAGFRKDRSRITNHESRLIGFGILWFFITLSVESSIIPIDDVLVEHRLYLPSVGFFLALAAAGWWLVRRLQTKQPGIGRVAAAFGAVVVLTLAGATFARNMVWQDKIDLWQDVVAKSPRNARAYNNLGGYYDARGEYEKAIPYFRKAIALKPDMAEALFHLGLAHAGLKKLDQAIFYYQKALALQPANPKILYNLGVAYMSKGRMDLAAIAFQEAIRLNPKMNQARMFLDYAQSQMGK